MALTLRVSCLHTGVDSQKLELLMSPDLPDSCTPPRGLRDPHQTILHGDLAVQAEPLGYLHVPKKFDLVQLWGHSGANSTNAKPPGQSYSGPTFANTGCSANSPCHRLQQIPRRRRRREEHAGFACVRSAPDFSKAHPAGGPAPPWACLLAADLPSRTC